MRYKLRKLVNEYVSVHTKWTGSSTGVTHKRPAVRWHTTLSLQAHLLSVYVEPPWFGSHDYEFVEFNQNQKYISVNCLTRSHISQAWPLSNKGTGWCQRGDCSCVREPLPSIRGGTWHPILWVPWFQLCFIYVFRFRICALNAVPYISPLYFLVS